MSDVLGRGTGGILGGIFGGLGSALQSSLRENPETTHAREQSAIAAADAANAGTAPGQVNPNGYRGYNPGQSVPGLVHSLQGGQAGIGVSQGMGGAMMPQPPQAGGYQPQGQGDNQIQQQLQAIQGALTGNKGGYGV